MSSALWIVVVIVAIFIFLITWYVFKRVKLSKKNKKDKPKNEKKIKLKKVKEKEDDIKDIHVNIAEKFLFRKELKMLILINKILPNGYVVFPKIGVDLIINSNSNISEMVRGKYVDMVIFEENTMKPKVVVDLFDGSLGDEQLEIEKPEILQVLTKAEMPIVSFKVKADYTNEEIKEPIFKALKIDDKAKIEERK